MAPAELCVARNQARPEHYPKVSESTSRGQRRTHSEKALPLFLGRTGEKLCPVAAILGYMAIRPQCEGPLLVWGDHTLLRQDRFAQATRAILREAGFNPSQYSGHSFRIEAATSAVARGVPDHLIKTLERWQSEAYQLYIRCPPESLATIATHLARSTQETPLPH